MATLKVDTITSADTPTVSITDGASISGVTTFSSDINIADKIVHTGDTNTAIRFPSADTITAETGGSEAFRVDSSQRLLIGTTTEGSGGADELTINTPSGHGGMTIRTANDSNGNIWFSDGTSGAAEYAGWLQYAHASNNLNIGVNSVEKIRIHTDGSTSFATGICLGNALTYAAANELSDYEEGTFTPGFRVEGQGSNVGTSTEEGKYTKIGNMVTLWIYIVIDGTPSGTGANNAWEIKNLPFISVTDTDYHAVGSSRTHTLASGSYGTDVTFVPRIWTATTTGRLEVIDQGDYTVRNASSYMADNTNAMITITYAVQ